MSLASEKFQGFRLAQLIPDLQLRLLFLVKEETLRRVNRDLIKILSSLNLYDPQMTPFETKSTIQRNPQHVSFASGNARDCCCYNWYLNYLETFWWIRIVFRSPSGTPIINEVYCRSWPCDLCLLLSGNSRDPGLQLISELATSNYLSWHIIIIVQP